ncbi:MAG: hypothetical protein DRZ79_02460 [Candidatus Cloacimonadota bacterium]|nr:MAG: hypothetical protein DRZ79_02460 [Candidatus Cloacimonadota bacterium]
MPVTQKVASSSPVAPAINLSRAEKLGFLISGGNIFYTYVLYSSSTDKYYIGYTSNIDKRLTKHNNGNSRSTKAGIPWKLVHLEKYETKTEAIKREYEIKRTKSRKYIENLISQRRRSSR